MHLLDPGDFARGHHERDVAPAREGLARFPGHAGHVHAAFPGRADRFDHVGRPPAGRHRDEEIAAAPERLDLAGEDPPVPVVVRDRGEHGCVSAERYGRERLPVEDFAQLSGASRETKYDSSMEKVAGVIDQFCTFPALERVKLFERTLFSFLVGNEDMHLKNFSLITRNEKVELAPAYDFLNTTIALKGAKEELALPVKGKKSRLTRNDLLTYFARERLQINERVLNDVLSRFAKAMPAWRSSAASMAGPGHGF